MSKILRDIIAAWEKHKAAGPKYRCKRCGMNEFQAREVGCKFSPCPMELCAVLNNGKTTSMTDPALTLTERSQ